MATAIKIKSSPGIFCTKLVTDTATDWISSATLSSLRLMDSFPDNARKMIKTPIPTNMMKEIKFETVTM